MIKKYKVSDEARLRQLLLYTNDDTSLLAITKSTSCITSYAMYEQGEMIGFIAAWKSKIHPFCTYFRCITSNNLIGPLSDLIGHMENDLSEGDYPLQTILNSKSGLVDYYNKRFKLIRKTYLPTVSLVDIPSKCPLNLSGKVFSIDKIKSNSQLVIRLITLVKKIYEETHLVNPVANLNLIDWEKMIFAEDLIEEGSYLYINDNEDILAYSFLHEAENEDTVELGWKGSNSKTSRTNINSLVALQVVYAKQKGFKFIVGEFDDTDLYAMEVLDHFSFPKYEHLLTYQKTEKDDDK